MPTVNPSDAECLLHGIKIPEMLVIYRSSPFHVNPAFSFAGVVGFEPCTELTSVGYTEDVMLFHKFGFNALKLIIIRHLSKRKARMIAILAAMATSLFNKPESMATPCSVNAYGRADLGLFDVITICDIILTSSALLSHG